MESQEFKPHSTLQRVDVLFGIWALWGGFLMLLAHTDIVTQAWFQSFRFWVGQVVPTVNHPPVKEVIDPKIATSFLAMLWVTSPLAWLVFRHLPPNKLFKPRAWARDPRSGRTISAVALIAICGIVAFDYDFQSRRMGSWLYSNRPGFTFIASVMAAFPWFCIELVRAWWKRFDEATKDLER